MSSDFKTNGKVVYSCKDQVVWCPKYRRKVLVNNVDMRLKEIIHPTAQELRATGTELDVMSDHVHLCYEVEQQFGIHRLVRNLKGRSSRLLRQEFPWLRRSAASGREEPATSAPAPDMDRMAVCKRGPRCVSPPWGGVEPLKQAAGRSPSVAWRSLQDPPPFMAGEFQPSNLHNIGIYYFTCPNSKRNE